MKKIIDVKNFVKSPFDIVSIKWEVRNPSGSGSTECEAWRAQYEIENLEKSRYIVLHVVRV